MRALVIICRLLPLVVSVTRDFRRWVWWGEPAERSAEFHQRRARRVVENITAL